MSEINAQTCEICLSGRPGADDPLIKVCNCNTIVHKSCGAQWFEITSQDNCENCNFKYIIKRVAKTSREYFKETPEEWEELKELVLRTVNISHLALITLIIWIHNPIGFVWLKYILMITAFRYVAIFRLWTMFGSRLVYSLREWKRTHFWVQLYPNPNPIPLIKPKDI